MSGTALIAMNEPWIDDEGIDVSLPAPRAGSFLSRHRADVILALSTLSTAVGAGVTARMLCGV